MSDFLQIHVLTAYPPSNPNRDDLGRPKTAMIGGRQRQRISSQAIKRALRKSKTFEEALAGQLGERTQRMGREIFTHLTTKGVEEKKATTIARDLAALFGKLADKKEADKKDKDADSKTDGETAKSPFDIKQLAFISPDEKRLALDLADKAAAGEALPKEKELVKAVMRTADGAVDVAMFGRMLADNPDYNREAAVQVSHAFTTNVVEIEDDYYTAVDDLKTAAEDAGAGFIGEAGFGAGIYYLYICVDRTLLVANLDGDTALAARGIKALVEALATASPSGKRNSFANHVRPEFMLVEQGDRQPRSLASAFVDPIHGTNQMVKSVERLVHQRNAFAAAYGKDWSDERVLHVGAEKTATLEELAAFAQKGLDDGKA